MEKWKTLLCIGGLYLCQFNISDVIFDSKVFITGNLHTNKNPYIHFVNKTLFCISNYYMNVRSDNYGEKQNKLFIIPDSFSINRFWKFKTSNVREFEFNVSDEKKFYAVFSADEYGNKNVNTFYFNLFTTWYLGNDNPSFIGYYPHKPHLWSKNSFCITKTKDGFNIDFAIVQKPSEIDLFVNEELVNRYIYM